MDPKIQELIQEITSGQQNAEQAKTREVLQVLLTELIKSFKQFELELPQALIEITRAVKTDVAKEQKVRVTNTKELQSVFKPADRVSLDPAVVKELTSSMEAIREGLKSLKEQQVKLPTKAKEAIAVRLSDGEKFIEQLTQVITQGVGGGGSVPKVTTSGGIQAVPVVNPDGSNISGGGGSGGLTDAELRATPVPVSGTVTANLSATDNAVLDSIDTSTQGILADTAAIQTAVEVLDNAISGSEMQVDVVGALPAGTNAIGKLAANSGVDIGDVTLTAGTAAIGTTLPPDIDVTTHTNYAKKYYTNAGAVTDGIIWSPAAGKRWHVVALHIQVSAACTVTLEDDKSGGDEAIFKAEYAANGGEFLVFPEHYPLASGEDAADLLVTSSAGNIYITAVGYEI